MKLKVDVAQINRESSFPTADTTATWNAGLGKLTNAPDSGLDGVATLSFPLGGANFMVTGVSLHRDSVKRTSYTLSNWRDADSKTAVQDQYNGQSSTTSLFAQDEISATDRLTIYVGGRFDQWETSGDFLRNTTPATSSIYQTRTQTTFNPKVAGVYKPVDALTLRASVGKSFRAPTIFEMYSVSRTAAGVVTQGDPSLKSESGRSWELGGEWRVNERLKTSTTYYETSLNDMIYIQMISPTLKQRMNAGKTKVRGFELGAAAQLTPWLAINTNVSWIDSLMLENAADPTSVGKQLTDVPNRLAYLGLTASAGQWSGTLEARYTGKVYSSAANTDTAVNVFGSYDANTMINLKAGYQVDKTTRFNLAVNNLLDYQAFQYSLLPGRNVTAELVMSF
jgi:iron complex outermembrane receptor protein